MNERLWIKICGVTRAADAQLAVTAGADAIGVNFVEGSPRRVDASTARAILEAVDGRAEVVAVVANLSVQRLAELRAETGIEWLQLHGAEAPSTLNAVLPRAFKAVRVAVAADVEGAGAYAGERLLVDSKASGSLGGTGQAFDWELIRELVASRRVIVAGGLGPDNVADAVERLRPWGIDVASGVERPGQPGSKDPDEVRRFVERARAAYARRP